MKFKNLGESVRIRIPEGKGFKRIKVNTNEVVDIPEYIGLVYKFEEVKPEPKKEKPKKESKSRKHLK